MMLVLSTCLALYSASMRTAIRGIEPKGLGCFNPPGMIVEPFEKVYIAGPSDSEFLAVDDIQPDR